MPKPPPWTPPFSPPATSLAFYADLHDRLRGTGHRLQLGVMPELNSAKAPIGIRACAVSIDKSMSGNAHTIDDAARAFARRAGRIHHEPAVRTACKSLCARWGIPT